jgi:predicted phosphodiesterase
MRLAFIADIHANHFALRSVLQDILSLNVDLIFCAGDIFGYYPWAQSTYDLIRECRFTSVLGNHDILVLHSLGLLHQNLKIDRSILNGPVFDAAQEDGRDLSLPGKKWLSSLDVCLCKKVAEWEILMFHGTPDNPLEGRFYPRWFGVTCEKAQPFWESAK